MVVMFILMLLPILAIPVFWLLPLGEAVGVYAACIVVSGVVYWLMIRNMRRRIKTGVESLIGKEVKVTSYLESDKVTPYRVHMQGEIWKASSEDTLKAGDSAIIEEVHGNRLIVKPRDDQSQEKDEVKQS